MYEYKYNKYKSKYLMSKVPKSEDSNNENLGSMIIKLDNTNLNDNKRKSVSVGTCTLHNVLVKIYNELKNYY